MAKVDRQGRSKGDSKHVRRYAWMLDSNAYRSLTCYARCLLEELQLRYNGSNNGDIFFSIRQASEALGCSVPTAMKAFRDLQDRQFIVFRVKGAFSRKDRHATLWILTEYAVGNTAATKDFMRWRPPEIQNTVQRRLADGAMGFNRGSRKLPPKGPHGVTSLNRHHTLEGFNGATSFNTSSLPGG